MLMSEDLHHIDDLFREGIEGHEEAVPPLVWEGVSNDLDKKQAHYYKIKYNKLRRAALVLVLLCFLGGVYIIYSESGKEQAAAGGYSEVKIDTTLGGNSTYISKERKEQIEAPIERSDSSSVTKGSTGFDLQKKTGNKNETEQNIKESQPADVENRISTEGASNRKAGITTSNEKKMKTHQSSGLVFQDEKIKGSYKDPVTFKKEFSNAATSPGNILRVVPLTARDFSSPSIQLQALPVNSKTILPATSAKSLKSKAVSASGLSISAFAAPNFSFERLEDNDRLAGPGRNRRDAHREEQENSSFSSGVLLNYDFGKNWRLQSGVSYTSSTTSIAPKTIYAKTDNNGQTRYELHCSSGYAYIAPKGAAQISAGDSATTSGTVTKLAYVTIPASIGYRITAGRISLTPAIGAGLNILSSGKTTTSISHGGGSEDASTNISGLKPTYLDAQIGLGIEYGVNRNLSIEIRPNARLAITPINKETPVKSYQNFLSLEAGVRIKLN
jgi:cbb3-type cytochrome oxidase subunit 3